MHFIRVLLTAALFVLAASGYAHAEPITIGLFGTVFAASWAGAAVTYAITAVAGFAINYGLSLLNKAKESTQAPQGFQLEAQVGDAVPLSFHAGFAATGGTRKYIGSWGNDGDTPNAFLSDCYQISDFPGSGLNGFWADKIKRTILWGEANDIGAPVSEFRINGKDHMWVRYRSGAETTGDAFLVSRFGSHPTRPWTPLMIGRGCEQVIVTMLVNREVFSTQPSFLFEPAPRVWYDLRKDSTNGGSGADRWADQSTWGPSLNPAVITYNIIRGVYYGDEWVYGGQNLPAFRLPASSWMAAANECDVAIPLAAGGTEPQFRCGTEIRGDVEPLAQIQELLVACNGRLAEVGGIFELLVGAPGAAVFSFTDGDIRITTSQGMTPFPSLQDTHNGIEATYPEPLEMWATKDAPARYSDTMEAEDGDRRLLTGVNYGAVPFGTQVQRLMKSGIEEDRRFRIHEYALPPEAWPLTPNTVVSWSSTDQGYENKKFLIIRKTGEQGMMQHVVLKEIDPTDYSWSSDDELPSGVGPLNPVGVDPQPMTGWSVLPYTHYDSASRARRPGIQISYAGGLADVRAVHVQIRRDGEDDPFFDSDDYPYDPAIVTPSNYIIGEFLLPDEDYEVRGIFAAFSGRPMEWSDWLDVRTPDVKLLAGVDFDPYEGAIGFDQLGPDVAGYQAWLGMTVRELFEQSQAQAILAGDQEQANASMFSEVRREVASSAGDLSATFSEVITTAIVPIGGQLVALADALTQLSAADGTDLTTARWRMTAMSGPIGYARVGIETRVDVADPNDFRIAGTYWDTPNNPALPTRIVNEADQFIIVASGNYLDPFFFDGTALRVRNAMIANLESGNIATNTITADRMNVTALSALTANLGTVTAGIARSTNSKLIIDFNSVYILMAD